MKLCLIRHADAGGPDRERYPDDRLRPLTGDGEREHRFIARALARMGVTATRLLTSPLQRARETAEITAQGLGFAGVIEVIEALGDRFSAWGLLDELAGLPDGAAVVCVGHEPHLSGFAATLLHADETVRIALPRSGVIGLECAGSPAPGACRLLFVLPPREMLRLVGSTDNAPGMGEAVEIRATEPVATAERLCCHWVLLTGPDMSTTSALGTGPGDLARAREERCG